MIMCDVLRCVLLARVLAGPYENKGKPINFAKILNSFTTARHKA